MVGAPKMASLLESHGVLLEWASVTVDAAIEMTKAIIRQMEINPGEAEQQALMALIPATPEAEADWLSRNADPTEATIS